MVDPVPGSNQRAAVRMSEDEVNAFLAQRRSMTFSTLGADGFIHSVAMWYGVVDGRVGFVSKRKAQKVLNLMRDPRLTCLIEDGDAYSELRGVSLIGRACIDESAASVEAVARSIHGRYSDNAGSFDAAASARNR